MGYTFENDLSEEGSDALESALLTKESAFEIHKVLHDLEEPYKEVFSLRVFGELSFKQIGQLFGKTEIVSLIFALLISAFWGLTQWHGIPIESKNLRVTQVSQVDDGVIYCELGLWDDADGFGYFEYTLTEDGKLYLTPMRSIITKADRWSDVCFYRDVNNLWGLRGIELGSKATGFYFGTPEDHLVIWEEGMELLPADEETEQKWVRERTRYRDEMDKLKEKLDELQDEYEATRREETE